MYEQKDCGVLVVLLCQACHGSANVYINKSIRDTSSQDSRFSFIGQ